MIEKEKELLKNIKGDLRNLESMIKTAKDVEEEGFYRFYDGSYKATLIKYSTDDFLRALKRISPNSENHFSDEFNYIIKQQEKVDTSKTIRIIKNPQQEFLPLFTAYSHAKYFIEMAIKYGRTLEEPPGPL